MKNQSSDTSGSKQRPDSTPRSKFYPSPDEDTEELQDEDGCARCGWPEPTGRCSCCGHFNGPDRPLAAWTPRRVLPLLRAVAPPPTPAESDLAACEHERHLSRQDEARRGKTEQTLHTSGLTARPL